MDTPEMEIHGTKNPRHGADLKETEDTRRRWDVGYLLLASEGVLLAGRGALPVRCRGLSLAHIRSSIFNASRRWSSRNHPVAGIRHRRRQFLCSRHTSQPIFLDRTCAAHW